MILGRLSAALQGRHAKSRRLPRCGLASIPPGHRFGPSPGAGVPGSRGGKPRLLSVGTVRGTHRRGLLVEELREPVVDVLDEGATLVVIAELPRTRAANIRVEVEEALLVLSATSGKRTYRKEIWLPSRPDPNKIRSSFHNGIVEIQVGKLPGEDGVKPLPASSLP